MTITLDAALAEAPLVAIIRGVTPVEADAVADALYRGGVRVVEVPLNSPDPFASIAALAERWGDRMVVGAGTVLDPRAVADAAAAGARIMVSPNVRPDVIAATRAAGLEPLPGFATASEAFAAYDAGARRLKLFPAGSLGPGYARALAEVLPRDAQLFAVGGIGAAGLEPWWRAGVRAYGVGGELYRPGASPEAVREAAERLVAAVAALRQPPEAAAR